MAFGQTQSRSQQFNQNIDKLLQYLMQTNLLEQRQAGSMEYLTEQQKGWQGLQKTQAKDSRSLLMEKYIMELSRDETVRRLQATIFWKEHNGQDATAEKEQLRQAAYDLTTAGAGALKGRFGPEMMKAIPNLTDEAFRALINQGGPAVRQAEHIERVDEPTRKLREREAGQKDVELGLRGREVTVKESDVGDKYYRNIHAKVNGAISYLDTLKKEGGGLDLGKLLTSGELTQTEGLVGGALTTQSVGNLMSKLSTLDTKAMRGALTPEEESFIDKAYDIFGYKKSMEKDEYGFTIGQTMTAPDGTLNEYIGNNRWKLISQTPSAQPNSSTISQ